MAQESRLVISIDARNAERTAKDLAVELQNITNSGNKADKQVGVLGSSLRTLAGYMAGVLTVGTAINKMDAYSNLQNRLRLVTTSQKELNQATTDTFAIAQKTYQSWDSVVQVYQRFSDNAKTLKINMQQTAKLTETVSKAVAISGASTQAAEAALTQFGQALASGVLRGEELNSVMEQTPALAKAIASGMGITIGQLRTVAAEGKITSEVLVKALGKAAEKVDQDFSKMQMTIGQSITVLDNQLTKFAESSGGAASAISGSIKIISENLELIAGAGIVAGIGYLTAAIVAKTTAVSADVAASIAQRNATIANAQAELAESVAVTNEAKAHLANVKAVTAETQAKFGATQASLQYRNASTAVTVALQQQTVAQQRLSAAQSIVTGTGSKLLGVLGGPVGIGLTVASLAAGYLLMRDNTAEANKKLDEQAKIASKTTEELLKLEGAQKANARDDLKAVLKSQNDELKRSSTAIGNYIAEISSKNTADAKTAEILLKVRTRVMSYDDALKELNKTHADKPDIIGKMTTEIEKYKGLAEQAINTSAKLETLGEKTRVAGNEAQNSVIKHNAQANALNGVEGAANGAASALSKYAQQALDAGKQAQITNALMNKGYSAENAKDLAEVAAKNGKVTQAEAKAILYKNQQQEQLNKTIEAQRKIESDAASSRSKAQKQTMSDAKNGVKQLEQLHNEIASMQDSLEYEFVNESVRRTIDLERKKAEIRKAFASDPETMNKMLSMAQTRFDNEKELYDMMLAEELYGWKLSEEEKIKLSYQINLNKIKASTEYNDEEKKSRIKSLQEITAYEIAQAKLSYEQRVFQAQQSLMTEMDALKRRYELERDEIELVTDSKLKAILAVASAENEARQIREMQDASRNALEQQDANAGGYGDYYNLQKGLEDQQKIIEDAYEKQVITEEEKNARLLRSQMDYQLAVQKLNLSYGEQITGSMADMFKTMGGEQSKAYKVMFAASKAFAIAQSAIAITQGIAMAAANPFPLNLVAMATVAAETASLVGNIRSIKDVGFQTGGYTGNGGVSDVAGVVHGQEYVLNASATKRVGVDTLNAINSGGSLGGSAVNITINTPVGYTATTREDSNGVTIDVVEQKIAESWSKLSRPNSNESRAVQSSFGLQPAR